MKPQRDLINTSGVLICSLLVEYLYVATNVTLMKNFITDSLKDSRFSIETFTDTLKILRDVVSVSTHRPTISSSLRFCASGFIPQVSSPNFRGAVFHATKSTISSMMSIRSGWGSVFSGSIVVARPGYVGHIRIVFHVRVCESATRPRSLLRRHSAILRPLVC